MQNGQENYIEKGSVSLEEHLLVKEENLQLRAELTYLKQELSQLKRMIFGSKSERFIQEDTGQLSLGMDIPKQDTPEVETEDLSFTRKKQSKQKKTPIRLPLPSHLRREEHIIEPEGDLTGAKKIGEELTEYLEYTEGTFHVVQYKRSKYVLPNEGGIVIGELPSLPIPKGNAGPGLLSHILISKFQDHLPFYR